MVHQTLLKDTPENLIRQYYKLLIQKGIPVTKMIMFGSQSKGNARYDSDIDVCVVSKSFSKNTFKELVRLSKIAAEIEPLIEPHPFTPEELEERYNPLAEEILKYGKVII